MQRYSFEQILLPEGWAHQVLVGVSDDGFITLIEPGAPSGSVNTEAVSGIAIPGMANAHSHAFQRAMAGNTEFRTGTRDSFWTWRLAMYALANRIEPAELQILAAQLFVEMLKAGYTAVAEFHYLHRRSDGSRFGNGNALWDAITAAATEVGIALTFLPTLYQSSDFGAKPLKREQRRFAMDTDEFLRAVQERLSAERALSNSALRTGAAFHSLRAVSLDTMAIATRALLQMDASLPLHVHIAEQTKEVQACKKEFGMRPIDLLLQSGLVDKNWCLVHATHASPQELAGIAAAEATVCVSVTTEANLGDGFFDTHRFVNGGGRLCIGSDSQSTVCPAEELRWLEYQQRLRKRRRGVLASKTEPHVGTRLWRDAALYGAGAIGQPAGEISVGKRADWLILDPNHPTMVGAGAAAADHLVFAGGTAAIRDVMVAGRWVIRDRCHKEEITVSRRFAELLDRLAIS